MIHIPTYAILGVGLDWPTGQLDCFSTTWPVTFLTTVKQETAL